MSSTEGPETALIGEVEPTASGVPMLPWSWPEGARVLLAVLAISAAIGLMLRGGHRPAEAAKSEVVAQSELKLDPNKATAEALAALPHIGPTLARRIVDAQADGPFRSPEDIRARVRGIGPATLAQIKPYLRFESVPQVGPRIDSREIAIVDAGAGQPPAAPSLKPRSRTRKAKNSSVALAAKSAESPTP